MITVTQQSEHHYVISNAAGTPIGWTGTRTIGFAPMPTERAAIDAAAAAWPILQGGLSRHFPGWERAEVSLERLRVVHDGAHEWISDGLVPVARLYRPGSARGRRAFALELVLPSFASDGVAIALAPTLARAVEPFIVQDLPAAWSVVQPEAPPGPPAA